MTALRKILIEEEPVFAAPVARAPATKLYVVTNTAPAEAAAAHRIAAGPGGGGGRPAHALAVAIAWPAGVTRLTCHRVAV